LIGLLPESEILEKGLDITGTIKGVTLNVEEMRLDMIDLYEMVKKLNEENKVLKARLNSLENK
jgi:hypothetical protein